MSLHNLEYSWPSQETVLIHPMDASRAISSANSREKLLAIVKGSSQSFARTPQAWSVIGPV